MLFDYDETDIKSIMSYAKKIENKTFNDILDECKDYIHLYEEGEKLNRSDEFIKSLREDKFIKETNGKGQLGNFLEKYYFGYQPNSDQEADLAKAGVEIKQTPIDITAKGTMRAGERLSITMISFSEPVEEDFYKSHLWNKIQKILLVHYIRDKSINRLDNRIKFVNLFTPPKDDLKIIIEDYKKINDKIKAGKAHEISEGDTMYLGACTKGATAESSLRTQYYNPSVKAKARNFCFKQSYMNVVLNNYILNPGYDMDSIVDTLGDYDKPFDQLILDTINQYIGKTDEELCSLFGLEYTRNKAQWDTLAYRMLGIKNNRAEEFVKANIVVKIVRIEQNGKNKESISFAPFKFKELINETWEDSTIYNYFESTRFLFVVYKSNGYNYYLESAKFWNMPYEDLEVTVKKEWLSIVDTIKTGVTFEKTTRGITNNLPGISDTKILHVRPHATKAAYKLNDGTVCGNIIRDADELPDGQYMTRQSFWINSKYVLNEILNEKSNLYKK